MTELNLNRQIGESEEQYIWRVGGYIADGLLGPSPIAAWEAVAERINEQFRDPADEPHRGESAYRKQYQTARRFWEKLFSMWSGSRKQDESIQKQLDELAIAKKQFYDQRREYSKQLVGHARAQHLYEEMIRVVGEMQNELPVSFTVTQGDGVTTDTEAMLVFSDWHYGMTTDNIWNKYDVNICKSRVAQVVCAASEKLARHKPKRLHIVVLGDMFHGAIHTGCRVAAEEDTVSQLMHSTELLANAIIALSDVVPEVFVYSTYGNHARTVQNKADSVHADNMERVIPWWLKQRFDQVSCKNITMVDANVGEYLFFDICGYTIAASHGDLDTLKTAGVNINTLLSKKFGKTVDYVFVADKHHLESHGSFGIDAILVRSLCGVDEYANNHRVFDDPAQTLCFFSPGQHMDGHYELRL